MVSIWRPIRVLSGKSRKVFPLKCEFRFFGRDISDGRKDVLLGEEVSREHLLLDVALLVAAREVAFSRRMVKLPRWPLQMS